ncbi:hypothetical protein RRG08_050997 [Elysia crispata]|uniref:Uncharacterized protein n=1 Tax=Elysia crispata TaxID=231223 RepID=A0AAE0YWY1_9GAST|nr:hypothetical protein RRG08_050997 [Elysia crispata]
MDYWLETGRCENWGGQRWTIGWRQCLGTGKCADLLVLDTGECVDLLVLDTGLPKVLWGLWVLEIGLQRAPSRAFAEHFLTKHCSSGVSGDHQLDQLDTVGLSSCLKGKAAD